MSVGSGKKQMGISDQNFAEITDHNELISLSKATGPSGNVYGLQVRILSPV